MSQLKRVLLTGGCGYIGSHTLVELLGTTRYEVHILDNLSNSSVEPLRRVETIVNAPGTVVQNFHHMDLCDEAKVDELFARIHFDAVIHFAGLKAVGESVSMPLWYYQNNLVSTLVLLKAMKNHGCNAIIFSSSATVYGLPRSVPITEDFVIQPTNPYGQTKGMIEQILQDAAVADAQLRVVILRYFNPVGAHKSGTIGESPKQPNNLLPYVAQVAVGRRPFLSVMGNDYDTPDGTGVRDYIHVVDLAKAHVAAVDHGALSAEQWHGCRVYNIGCGKGYSVLDMVHAFEKASGRPIPYQIVARRPGDIGTCYANPEKAKAELHWEAQANIDDMCADAWRWQSSNPYGYDEAPAQ